jgi:hypothetical protein
MLTLPMSRERLERIAKLNVFVALFVGLFFETLYFLGFFNETSSWKQLLLNLLYPINLLIILSAAMILFLAYLTAKRVTLLLGSLGTFSWFLGSFFWVSYVFILKDILIYPSVAEFAFQGFHLLMIVALYNLIKVNKLKINWLWFALVPVITLIPATNLIFQEIKLNNLLYSTFFLFLVSSSLFLSLNLLLNKRYLLLCLGMFLIIFADTYFVSTYLSENVFVFMLDPMWFGGYALISFSLLKYANRGELP